MWYLETKQNVWYCNGEFFYFCNNKFYKNGMIYGWDGGIPVMDY